MSDKNDNWREILREIGEEGEESEELLPTLKQLQGWKAPAPTAQARMHLLETLLPALPAPATPSNRWRERLNSWWPWLLLRAQLRVVRGEIWLGSALF